MCPAKIPPARGHLSEADTCSNSSGRFWTNRDGSITEIPPTHCPNGHELRYPNVIAWHRRLACKATSTAGLTIRSWRLRRSWGLYDQIWRQMAFGHAVKARMSCRRCPGVRRPGQFVAGRVEQPAEQGVDGVGVGLVRVPSLARPRQALVWAHRIGGSSP
jgi:hypothetical protein